MFTSDDKVFLTKDKMHKRWWANFLEEIGS